MSPEFTAPLPSKSAAESPAVTLASHAASVETEGDLTTALLLDFPVHLLHDVHPGSAFGGQGGKFNDHRLSQARPWLEAHATQQHEQHPACPHSTTHATSGL